MITTPRLAVAALVLGQFGCATMTLEQAPPTTRIVATRQAPENGDRLTPHVAQDGPIVQMQLDGDCQLQVYDRVETTEHFSNVNKSAWVDWTAGIGGAAFVGLGAYTLVDASKTYPNDPSSRTYNSSGPGADTGLAITSFVVGGALLAVAVVDVIRAQHHQQKSSVEERKGSVAGSCGTKPVANTPVRLVFADQQQVDATTDSTGRVSFDASRLRAVPSSTATMLVSGKVSGVPINLPQFAAWQRQKASDAATASSAASDAAMGEARRQDRAEMTAALDQVETNLVTLERAKQPWTDRELERFQFVLVPAVNKLAEPPRGDPLELRRATILSRTGKLIPLAEALTKRRCQQKIDDGLRALARCTKLGNQITPTVCYQTCVGNGVESTVCSERCDVTGGEYAKACREFYEDGLFVQQCKCAPDHCK
jgi:hypothetical protein